MIRLVGVYGASGFGREVLPLVRLALANGRSESTELVFVDDGAYQGLLNGARVMPYGDFRNQPAVHRSISIAVADSVTRQSLTEKCASDGVELLSVRAANVVVMDDVEVGAGSILCPFVTITSNVRIGRSFHANIYSYVAHDCEIGDYVTFAPNVMCNGNVRVEDHAYIGTGAVIKQGRPGEPLIIGRGAVVGMGAVVTKSVPPGVTVVGNPARPLSKS